MNVLARLPDPEHCRLCHGDSQVIDSKPHPGYRYRRHECLECGYRWSTYQIKIDPRRLSFKVTVTQPSTSQV